MSNINRRWFLLGTTALVSCGAPGTPGTVGVPSQIITFGKAIDAGLLKAVPLISAAEPKILPATGGPGVISLATLTNAQGTGYLDLAATLLAGLTPTMSAADGASTLATVEKYFNSVLDAVAAVTPALALAVPALAPAVLFIDAAVVLLPIVEAFVTSIPSTATAAVAGRPASARAKARAPTVLEGGRRRPMSEDDARKILGVPMS